MTAFFDNPDLPGLGTTRREFLVKALAVGGSGLLLATMNAWGAGLASAVSTPPVLQGGGGGKKVVILGAGLAGMVAALELGKAGYQCEVIEARSYAGGRCQTARRGFTLSELGGETQVCDFDEGQYINHGPWRIPFCHRSTLHYAAELDVPLELFNNENDASYIYYENAGPLSRTRLRRFEIKADMRGNVDELLAKSIRDGRMDQTLSAEDKTLLLEYLVNEGYLGREDLTYRGTNGRGYKVYPGAGNQPGVESDPLGFGDLLKSKLGRIYRSVNDVMSQSTMLQAVGGMDQLAKAFERKVGHLIRYGTEVTQIRNGKDKVTVQCKDLKTGAQRTVEADFCLCTIPMSVLKQMDTDFSAEFKQAMQGNAYMPTGKMGLQFNRRFWELDHQIYGGHIGNDIKNIGIISLPSTQWQASKGTLLGYYNFGAAAAEVSALSHKDRTELALAAGEKIFPGEYRKHFAKSFSVAWHRVQYSLGGFSTWSGEARKTAFPRLLEGEGRTLLAGEHMSYLGGWMAGAIESSWQQIERLHARNAA